MLRTTVYVALGWLLIAVVASVATALGFSIMLPATSVIVICHAAFSNRQSFVAGLATAVALGYLEDLHQGAPLGTLCLSYTLVFMLLRWAAERIHVSGWPRQAVISAIGCGMVDVAAWSIMVLLGPTVGGSRDALWLALQNVRWHALATLLAAPAVWWLLQRTVQWICPERESTSELLGRRY